MKLSISEAARLAGARIPRDVPAKWYCPIREHKRKDKTFRVFRTPQGEELWKCWSCDEPENAGDALKLYALLSGRSRKDAWKELRDRGYEFEGRGAPAPSLCRPVVSTKRFVEPRKTVVEVLPLDPREVQRWQANPMDRVVGFLASRGLPTTASWKDFDVLSLAQDCMGFLYRDPNSGVPCRVKVRGLREKKFWNEPRPDPARPGAKAKAPLWFADRLEVGHPAIIVEGEMDALTLAVLGFRNVVSLPDGSESANTVDLSPLRSSCDTWVVAVDDDAPGDRAWQALAQRARGTGNHAVRCRMHASGVTFKDANDALQNGFTKDDFDRCIRGAMEEVHEAAE